MQEMEKAGHPTQVRGMPGRTNHPIMAEHRALNKTRANAARKERRQVVFKEVACEEGTTRRENTLDVALIYKLVANELAADPNSQLNTVEAIFTAEPTNHWRWSIIFDYSTTTGKKISLGRYHVRTKVAQ